MGKSKNIQLDLSKRQTIENMLTNQKTATEIGRALNMHKSTISREVFKYRTLYFVGDKTGSVCSFCLNAVNCKAKNIDVDGVYVLHFSRSVKL